MLQVPDWVRMYIGSSVERGVLVARARRAPRANRETIVVVGTCTP